LRENQQLYSGWWLSPTPLKNDGQPVRQGMIFPFPTVSGQSFTSHVPNHVFPGRGCPDGGGDMKMLIYKKCTLM